MKHIKSIGGRKAASKSGKFAHNAAAALISVLLLMGDEQAPYSGVMCTLKLFLTYFNPDRRRHKLGSLVNTLALPMVIRSNLLELSLPFCEKAKIDLTLRIARTDVEAKADLALWLEAFDAAKGIWPGLDSGSETFLQTMVSYRDHVVRTRDLPGGTVDISIVVVRTLSGKPIVWVCLREEAAEIMGG